MPASGMKALVIEDSKATRDSLGKLLRLNGWEAVTVADTFELHRYINSGVRNPYHVIIVDLNIPGSGVTAIELIRATGMRTPGVAGAVRVVAYTAFDAADPTVRAALEAGADAVVLKPATFEHLLAVAKGGAGDVPKDGS